MLTLADVHTTQLNDPSSTLDGLNCSAAIGAEAVKWFYRNAKPDFPVYSWPPTPGHVRELTRNPDGSPDITGGLNYTQVSQAIWRGWGVLMTVMIGADAIPFEDAWDLAEDPDTFVALAIRYGTLVGTQYDAGRGFVGNHAVAIAAADRGYADWSDPLADGRRPGIPNGVQRIPRWLVSEACGDLIVNGAGAQAGGLAWCAVVRALPLPEPPPEPPAETGDPMDNLFPDTLLHYVLDLPAGTVFYADATLETRYSITSKAGPFALLGAPIGVDAFRVANGDRGVFVARGSLKPRRVDAPVRVGK